MLSRTVYGQQLYAIGANPTAARYSGIRFKRNITVAYVITGLCVGLAALIMMSNALSSNPQAASGSEMEIILCVVLGGCAVQGGKGSVWGTIIGVLFYLSLIHIFKTLLLNLLDNAMKSGASQVRVTGTPEGNRYRICVADNGRGIPSDQLQRITEAFYMVDKSRSRREHGAGLGLALCARIAAIHGTELDYDSVEGEGTAVTVELPLCPGEEEQP